MYFLMLYPIAALIINLFLFLIPRFHILFIPPKLIKVPCVGSTVEIRCIFNRFAFCFF